MATNVYLDTETIGFHGLATLLQCAYDDGPVELCNTFDVPCDTIVSIIENICKHTVVGFNLEFDWFHINKLYNVCRKLPPGMRIRDNIALVCKVEQSQEPNSGSRGAAADWCVKPVSAIDVMVAARNGPYQTLMDRDSVNIRRVPRIIAHDIIAALNSEIKLPDIYFAKAANPKRRWVVRDCVTDGKVRPDIVNLGLDFSPDGGLKSLAAAELGATVAEYDASLPRPEESGYAPYALASELGWHKVWEAHAEHWRGRGIEYATNDVIWTRDLYKRLVSESDRETGSRVRINSELACLIGAVRWRGYSVDIAAIKALMEKNKRTVETESIIDIAGKMERVNFNSSHVALTYIRKKMTEIESLALKDPATGKFVCDKIRLGMIAKWKVSVLCELCSGTGCETCGGHGMIDSPEPHPAAARAEQIIRVRAAVRESSELQKLVSANRFHASFKVMGALSGRMSGSDGLNAQGINKRKDVRRCFPLTDPGYVLEGGDFSGFEVVISLAVYRDPELLNDVLTKRPCRRCRPNAETQGAGCKACANTGLEDTKIHALLGQYLFPGMSYDAIMDTSGKPGSADLYSRAKQGTFALLYGGEEHTLATRVGIPEEVGKAAYDRWCKRYVVWGAAREQIKNDFCSMRQETLGGKVVWNDPAEWIETMFGYRRYFTLENKIAKVLFGLAEKPPQSWKDCKIKITRRDKEQTAAGAARSACYGAAFGIQGACMRAAANHTIQGTGAEACKRLQHAIWQAQPSGVNVWHVIPMNVHDEVQCPMLPEVRDHVVKLRNEYMDELKKLVPLAELDWSDNMTTWADK